MSNIPGGVGGTPEEPELRDYVAWHTAYDDPSSPLSKRLRRVQAEVRAWLDRSPGEVRFVSLCAGDGRDILVPLAEAADRSRVSGTFVEIDPVLVARSEAAIAGLGLADRINVRRADAGLTDTYTDLPRADLVMASGIMGNITPDDIRTLIRTTRSLAAPGATVIWTRGAQEPDLGPEIRRWFSEEGFEELACHEQVDGSPMRVGVNRLVEPPDQLPSGERIFTFYR